MGLRLRKNHLSLSSAEKSRFVAALLELKAKGVYDKLVKEHRTAMPPMGMGGMGAMGGMTMAHRCPWFLPWHRQFLLRLELELRKADSRVVLPYWNWLRDRKPSSPLWAPDFMGGDGTGAAAHVADGPFAFAAGKWRLTIQSDGSKDPALRREIGRNPEARLPSTSRIGAAMKRTPYDTSPWNDEERGPVLGAGFRPWLEHVVHDPVHGWVGGTMELATSPNDPVFFLHHANVDRLWTVWQNTHESADPYLPISGGGKYDADRPMPVYPTTPSTLVSSRRRPLEYRYDEEERP
jgi:tyrosinase